VTQDREPQRTADADGFWTPYASDPVRGTVAPTVDARPSAVHADAGWSPVVIEGGRGRADEPQADAALVDGESAGADGAGDDFESAVDDALAVAEPAAATAEPTPVPRPEPDPEPAHDSPAAAVEAPAPEPASAPQTPLAPPTGPESTLRTPHPGQAPTEAATPAQEPATAQETPHSTPQVGDRVWSWRAAVGWLNLHEVLDAPLPPVREIYHAAWDSVAARSGFDRATEIALVCGVGVPLSIVARVLDRTGHTKWRILGTSAIAVLWTLAALTGPVDVSTLAWWTVLGYWASTVIVIPAVIKATE
jgi:hypothetical protein